MSFDGKFKKAITFSFDDGNIDDIRLVALFNKYGLKSTFNLNSSLLADNEIWRFKGIKDVHHINFYENTGLYDGHEVAAHTVRHCHLENLRRESKVSEIELDRVYLKALFGYDIEGMALPFGTYDEEVLEILKEYGILYCRTVKATDGFDFPDTLPLLHPTCHFLSPKLDELTGRFLNGDSDQDMLFYIWGHSYELVEEEDWNRFEDFCKRISGLPDVYYCTNKEAILNHN